MIAAIAVNTGRDHRYEKEGPNNHPGICRSNWNGLDAMAVNRGYSIPDPSETLIGQRVQGKHFSALLAKALKRHRWIFLAEVVPDMLFVPD